ncbi:MAG: hypothetical protein Q9184_001992 [Pyrenodesmia sp. 2 TL-2023]
MRLLQLLHAETIRPTLTWRWLFRSVRYVQRYNSSWEYIGRGEDPPAKHKSLFDEIFAEESENPTTSTDPDHDEIEIPRLPLSELGHFSRGNEEPQKSATEVTEAPDQVAVKHWNPAVLVVSRASKSLIDADFRRIAPKGCHTGDATGPGDVLKGRDPITFQQRNHYFLLFPNTMYARTYQKHVMKLHKLAQRHTPTSLQSPLPPTVGTIIEGEDAQTFLQEYALCPPSQRIWIISMFAPFGNTVKPLVEHQGYPQLTVPASRGGRAVLLWIDGHTPTTRAVKAAIDQDGRDRALPWAIEGSSRSVEKLSLPTASPEDTEGLEPVEPGIKGRSFARWIVTFVDENEARRFVRAWHRRPFRLSGDAVRGADAPLVNTEFLW